MGRGRKGDIRKLLKAGGSASIALAPLALWLAADSLSDKSNKRADGTRQNFFGDQGTDVIDSRAFSYGASIGSGALIGAKIGSFIMPGLGTAAGGAIGASAGGLAALFADYEDDLVDKERKYQYEIMTNRYGSAAAGIALSQNNIPDDVRMEASRRANLETDSMFAATSTFGGAAPVINIMQRISRDIATNSTTIEKTFNPNNMSSWMTAAMAEGMNKSNISDILGLSALPFSGITSGIVGAASLGIGSGGGGRSTYSTSPRADTLSSPNAGAARTVTKTHKRYPTNTYTRKGNDGQLHAYVIDPTAPNGERDLGKFDYRRMYADVTEQIPVTENAAVAGAFKPYTGEGSGGAVTPAGYSGVYGQLLNNLAYSEGTANQANSGYDTEYAYKEYSPGSDIPISQMTLAQLDEYQTGMLNNQAAKGIGAKKRSSAAGRYQYIKTTLNSLKHKYHNDPAARARMAEYGIDFEDDTVFSPEFQDRLAAYTIGEERGGRKFLEGKMSLPQFMNQISKEWASALNAYGRGSYNQGTKGSYSFWHNTYADMQQNYQGGSGVSSSDFITAPADTSSDFLIGLHSGTPKAPSILMAPTETADSDFLTPSVKQVSPRVNPTMSNAEYAAQVEDMKKKPKGAWSALQRRIYSRMQTTPQAGVTNKPNDFSSQLDNMFASTIYNAFDNSPFDTSILRSAGLFSHPLPFNIPDIPSSFESAVNNIPEMDRINDGVSKAKSVINKARDMSPIHKMPNIGISLDELTFDAALGSLLNWDLMGD